jgi:hypothetical protein
MTLKEAQETLQLTTYDRYASFKDGRIIWHPEQELFHMSERILNWFYSDELGIIIVHGQQGYGKSTYAAISCSEVYGHDFNQERFRYDWEAVKKHIVFTPQQFIDLCYSSSAKEPMVVWDDAGYWLNAMDYRDKLCIQVSKYLEVARSRWGAIIFTVSDQRQILNKIRGIPHAWTIPIRKVGTPSIDQPAFRYKHDRRFARLHKSWCSEDMKRSGKKGKEGDVFYARMPSEFYNWYKPWRDLFCNQATIDMQKAAEDQQLYEKSNGDTTEETF